jgi:hypothetical protein
MCADCNPTFGSFAEFSTYAVITKASLLDKSQKDNPACISGEKAAFLPSCCSIMFVLFVEAVSCCPVT